MLTQRLSRPNIFMAALALLLCAQAVPAQTTAFTYQGKLKDSGSPVSGTYDMQFKLFDALADGNQVGAPVANASVAVADGIFTVELDFDAVAFDGSPRFLEICVRPADSKDPYTVLAPRQSITSTPYAIQTLNTQQLGGLPASRYIATDVNGNVGLGTPTPGHLLEVNGTTLMGAPGGVYGFSVDTGALPGPYPSLGFNAYGNFPYFAGVTGYGGLFQFQVGDGKFGYYSTDSGVAAGAAHTFIPRLIIGNNGNVGIGTTMPTTKLFVLSSTPGLSAIYGESASGRAVWGKSTSSRGVYGESTSLEGVYGISNSGSGVSGNSNTGTGVYGSSPTATGVHGFSTNGYGVVGEGALYGVQGLTPGGVGVLGHSSGGTGVIGVSEASFSLPSVVGSGVYGQTGLSSLTAAGVYGRGNSFIGVSIGVLGDTLMSQGIGVYGRNAQGGYAGYFEGKVRVTGVIEKAGGGFKIDHPLDPENKYLVHSFVESPDMKNLYDGTVTTDAYGEAVITLPDWFAALNRDFRYQLTCIGVFAQAIIAEKIKDNRFKIKTSLPDVEVSWQVTGTRQDAWANQNRLPIEEPKPAIERGSYQNPTAFGQPEEKGIEWARNPAGMKQQKVERERRLREKDNKDATIAAPPNHK